jgi:hypothetical protein
MIGFRSWFGCVTVAILSAMSGPASAEDFRVENRVFAAEQKEPIGQSTTIFHGNMVYDCLTTPAETVVFDMAAGRFIVLNLAKEMRCELSTAEITTFIDHLRSVAAKSKDPAARFLADPKFDEHSDNGDELTLTSPWVTYRVTMARQTDQELVTQYRESCDWYARLNALLVPGSRPPAGRLMLNAALAQRQATASHTVLTLASGKGGKQKTTIRSEHELIRPLEEADLKRVTQTRECMDVFKLVSFEQYRKADPR